jgi:hypothetical protein
MADSINTIDGLLRNAALGKNNGVALVDAPNRADFFDGNSQGGHGAKSIQLFNH